MGPPSGSERQTERHGCHRIPLWGQSFRCTAPFRAPFHSPTAPSGTIRRGSESLRLSALRGLSRVSELLSLLASRPSRPPISPSRSERQTERESLGGQGESLGESFGGVSRGQGFGVPRGPSFSHPVCAVPAEASEALTPKRHAREEINARRRDAELHDPARQKSLRLSVLECPTRTRRAP